MEYQATSKYIRSSTRKVRLVADAIRKLSPVLAVSTLERMPKDAAKPVGAVIASALANAKQKGVDVSTLTFKTIEVMGGPAMKRFRPASRGVAHSYKKRMTHVRIILTDTQTVVSIVKDTSGGNNGTKS
jgi:large subunit ribosomal protein L22